MGVVVGFGACVGGLFGMNLRSASSHCRRLKRLSMPVLALCVVCRSGLEDSFTAFYAVLVFCMVSCILTAIAVGMLTHSYGHQSQHTRLSVCLSDRIFLQEGTHAVARHHMSDW